LRHRRCIVLRGSPEATADDARAICAGLAEGEVLWVSEGDGVHPSATRALLGRAFDAVVLDLHGGLDPDVLGRCHGFVWGGGRLVLRMPPRGERPTASRERLATLPFTMDDVGHRFWDRFERCLERSEAVAPAAPIARALHDVGGTEEQRRVVERLASAFVSPTPTLSAILSDRGRGKSSALGLAIARARESKSGLRVALSASGPDAAAEVLRFAGAGLAFVPPLELARGGHAFDVIVIDEAAQLPVPLLQELVLRHPEAHIAFATTARGYEGTGRGFVLRFLEWLSGEPRPLTMYALSEPIRWAEGDPLERFVFDVLALDATPAPEDALSRALPLEHVALDRDRLAEDEVLLSDFFGLLVHAHYRTTPGDLHRLLDAPNVALHASLLSGRVVAATLVAIEGGLDAATCERMARGDGRIRGHALADTLVCHSGRVDAGRLRMIRSVRIAVHPALRREGIASALVDHVHRCHAPDLFGTVFGATPALLRFRRAVGYEIVRVGVSRGSRTGEPAAVMVRPVSEEARALVASLRADLARDLPLQLELLDAEGELAIAPRLAEALRAGLPTPSGLSEAERDAIVDSYLNGPRPYESAAYAITRYVDAHEGSLEALGSRDRALIEARVVDRVAWAVAAERAGFHSVPAAMRALRRAVRALVAAVRS
jgi:tRNA(Met) cytidine acetyltransferase